MKILILANKFPYPPRDGGSIATLNMICGMHDAGNQITCLALNTKKHSFPVEKIPPGLEKNIRFLAVDCNSAIRPLKLLFNLLFSREPYIALRFNIKAFRRALASLLLEETFDIIQLEGPYPGQYLDLIREESRARVSLRAHNVEHHIWERKALHEASLLKSWYFRNMARRLKRFELEVAQRVDLLVPISENDTSYFSESGLQKPVLTIPAGLNMENYPLTKLPDDPSICFIGALDWLPNQEGLDWFLRNVFNQLLSELPDLHFHLAGRNAPAFFEKKFKHPNIFFHGEVENAQAFIQSYQLMVAPLLTGSGIRVKILEATALGRPVITTSAGIEGLEIINHPCIIVEDDPLKFCSQLVKMLKAPQESEALLSETREVISRYFDTFELSSRLSQFYLTE